MMDQRPVQEGLEMLLVATTELRTFGLLGSDTAYIYVPGWDASPLLGYH